MIRRKERAQCVRLKNDLILIVCLILLALISLLLIRSFQQEGRQVSVSINGEIYAKYPLSSDVRVVLPTGADGANRNVLVIENGQASVSEADCPDLICSHHRPIAMEGETIVCIPNRTVIAIE